MELNVKNLRKLEVILAFLGLLSLGVAMVIGGTATLVFNLFASTGIVLVFTSLLLFLLDWCISMKEAVKSKETTLLFVLILTAVLIVRDFYF